MKMSDGMLKIEERPEHALYAYNEIFPEGERQPRKILVKEVMRLSGR